MKKRGMMTVDAGEGHLYRGTARLVRMERSAYRELSRRDKRAGYIGRIYRNGFDLVMESGRWVHFHNGDYLVSPISAILDQPVPRWMESVSLQVNDVILKKGNLLFREGNGGALIHFGRAETPDLRVPVLRAAPVSEIDRWMVLLSDAVCAAGHFAGLGGSLSLLQEEMPEWCRIRPPDAPNLWSGKAISVLRACLDGLRGGERESLDILWNGLLGLGAGLTTAGDDFLVGFLSAHQFLVSPFGFLLDQPQMKCDLKRQVRSRTNEIGFQFLDCALEGLFSENIHRLFAGLRDRTDDEKTRRYVTDCIHWGHSSGTDVVTGILFGLLTLRKKEEGKDGLGADIRH